MIVLAAISLGFATLALCFCAYLYLELQKRPLKSEVPSLLASSSDELNKNYARQFRALETEWDDMYQKFSKLAGRMDREKRLPTPSPDPNDHPPVTSPITRSELLRRYRAHV
jgi:hypothetical protein